MAIRTLSVDGPLSLRRTLGYVSAGWGRFLSDGWWRPMRTPDGPGTIHVRRDERGVIGEAWGAGADWCLERLPYLVGLHDDPSSFEPKDPAVRNLHRMHLGNRFGSTGLVFDALTYAIVGQKVTGREAGAGLRGLIRRFSEAAPGPNHRLRLPPDPEQIRAAPYHHFHELGIERKRADTLRRTAAAAEWLERTAAIESGAARNEMERIPGVGVWSSAEAAVVSHGDPDAVKVGDYHLKHIVSWHLAGEARGSDERMLELLEPFRPHRGRVARLLELSGRYPRYGPRQPIRSFTQY